MRSLRESNRAKGIGKHLAALTLCWAVMWPAAECSGQVTEQTLKSFGDTDAGGAYSIAPVIVGTDGLLYGTTGSGGTNGFGTVYSLKADGSGFTVLHHFSTNDSEGQYPSAGLLQGEDGVLYGTTGGGGTDGVGAIFRLTTNGTGYTVIYSFRTSGGDGQNPNVALVQGRDGALYGATGNGGSSGYGGTVYRLNPDGSDYAKIHDFSSSDGDGRSPLGALVQGQEGALYGTTWGGGAGGAGTVFRLSTDGTGYEVLYSFSNTGGDGQNPSAALVQGSEGSLYGTTFNGGNTGGGTLFRLNTNGTSFAVLHAFSKGDGQRPRGGLLQGHDGALYGTTSDDGSGVAGFGTLFKLAREGTNFMVLYRFDGSGRDGQHPSGTLAQDSDGTLYGTTPYGGQGGAGTVFKLSPDGTAFTVLRSFIGGDGDTPYAGLVQGRDGAFYGTTPWGGRSGAGTVFKLQSDGSGYAVLHSFNATVEDGQWPTAALLACSDRWLYGTTQTGGGSGGGTVFKLGPDGSGYTILHSFLTNSDEGEQPAAGLVQGSDGALYGTTLLGGNNGGGTVFKLNTNGTGYTVLHSFNPTNGSPSFSGAGLLEGLDGVLYGTTGWSAPSALGTVYRIDHDGTNYTVLHTFDLAGENPSSALIQGSDGVLYDCVNPGARCNRYESLSKARNGSTPVKIKRKIDLK